MKHSQLSLIATLILIGCAGPHVPAPPASAMLSGSAAEKRAAQDLRTASLASSQLGTEKGRQLYNRAAADLAVVLRSADHGELWNQPLTLTNGGERYQFHIAPGVGKGFWKPDTFTSFVRAERVSLKNIRHRDVQNGVGGALVGVRKKDPREPFTARVGVTGTVTATLDFHGHDVTLDLRNPDEQPTAMVAGSVRPLQADFSAPLAYYPAVNEFWAGLMAAMHVSDFMGKTGLYMLDPYDRDRIPLIFVHGLISTPQMWRNVVNEVEFDPQLRGRYQCWVFSYPTGYPAGYSALRFRQELAKGRQLYGWPHGVVLVGHSMGGLISHMQSVTLTRADWVRVVGKPAEDILSRAQPNGIIQQMAIVNANPDIKRTIYICTPHRGAEMAVGFVGRLARRLIILPAALAGSLENVFHGEVAIVSGDPRILPNGVTRLSPKNPTLEVMNSVPIQTTFHSIIGDRGRGDTPNSSDGIVPYWSSHLNGAVSEKIVPGPHGSCELPQTIGELKRILHLHLHLQAARNASTAPATQALSTSN